MAKLSEKELEYVMNTTGLSSLSNIKEESVDDEQKLIPSDYETDDNLEAEVMYKSVEESAATYARRLQHMHLESRV